MMEISKGYHQLSVINTTMNELYIPLQGKHTTNPDEEPFDLAEKIQSFFVFDEIARNDPKVMLLIGDTGAGKSVFSQQLHQYLWKDYKAGDPIPLWIPLPELQNPFEGAVEEVLKKQEFSEAQIVEMKVKERFIFIVDGYDELHQFQNCYLTNKWNEWKAKVLVTCRSQALYYQKDPDKYFVPFDGEKRLSWLLRKLYVASFSLDQIQAYVEAVNRLSEDPETKLEDFDKIPGLKELITTPFLLHLTVESLPAILAEQQANEENLKITQAKLYDVFIERWFTRQVLKLKAADQLKDNEQNTKQQFWDYCKRLAQRMHANDVTVIPYTLKKTGGRLFGKQEKKNSWEEFFSEETEILRSACPLKRMGEHHYGFIHASMVEYFATRAMYEEIQMQEAIEETPIENKDERVLEAENTEKRPKGGIHHRVFAKEPNAIRNLADRIEMKETFKQKMLNIVEKSKTNERYAIGAANAISALVRARVTFNGVDLAGIKISGADISGGYFDNADLSGSDLREVDLKRVWMRKAKLTGCLLNDVYFGEYPYFKHKDKVNSIVYRPDINRLVVASGVEVYIWDLAKRECIQVFIDSNGYKFKCVALSDDGCKMASLSHFDKKQVWDVVSGEEVEIENDVDSKNNIDLRRGAQKVASGNVDIIMVSNDFYNSKSSKKIIWRVNQSYDGRTMDAGRNEGDERKEGRVKVLDSATREEVMKWHNSEVDCVTQSRDGRTVVSGGKDEMVRVWNVERKQAVVLKGHEGNVSSVSMSEDGRTVVSGGVDATVRVWDMDSKRAIVLRGHEGCVNSVSISSDGQTVASGSEDKTVRIWDVASGIQSLLQEHTSVVKSVVFSRDGLTIASGSMDKTVRVWDVVSRKVVVLQGHANAVNSVTLSSDGRTVASGGEDKLVRVWDMVSGKVVVLRGHEQSIEGVALSGDGRTVAAGSHDSTMRVWDVVSGKAVVLRGHQDKILSVTLSANGYIAASGGWDKTVHVWDVANKKAIVLRGHQDWIRSVHLSIDGKTVVSGSDDYSVRIWDVASEKAIVLRGHEDLVRSVCLSDDGRTVVSGGKDYTVRIWDVELQSQIGVIHFNTVVNSVSFHESSGRVVVGLEDSSVQLWNRIDERGQNWQLVWSSNFYSLSIHATECDLRGVIGLSHQHEILLAQHGAIGVQAEIQKIIPPTKKSSEIEQGKFQQPEKIKESGRLKKFTGIFKNKKSTSTASEDTSNNKGNKKGALSKFNLFDKRSKHEQRKSEEDQNPKDLSGLGFQAPLPPVSHESESTKISPSSPRSWKKIDSPRQHNQPLPSSAVEPGEIEHQEEPPEGRSASLSSPPPLPPRFFVSRSPRHAAAVKKGSIDSVYEGAEDYETRDNSQQYE